MPLICSLTCWLVRHACRQARQWGCLARHPGSWPPCSPPSPGPIFFPRPGVKCGRIYTGSETHCHRPRTDGGRFGTLTLCYGERWKDTAWVHRKHISCFLNSGPDDVHVLNFGVWHNVPDGIPRAVNSMMDYLRAQAQAQPLPHLVWMESLPQHFNSPGGLYYTRRGRVKPGCMRRVQPGRLSNFRNKKTLSLLRDPRRQGAAALHVFRTWDMLAPHPELHNHVNSGALDCTHWCAYHGGALTAIAHLLLSDISRAFWRGAQPGPRSQGGGLPREGHAKEAAEMPVGVRYSEGAPEREI